MHPRPAQPPAARGGRRRLAALGLPPQGRQTEGPRPGAWGLQGAERPAAAPPEGWGHAAAKKGEGPANLPDQGGATAQGRLE